MLRTILGITWQDKVPNNEVLSRVGIPSMCIFLRQRRLHWLGYTHRMADGRTPKDLLYGGLATGRKVRLHLRCKDVCSVTWRLATSTHSRGKLLQTTELCGNKLFHTDWKVGRRQLVLHMMEPEQKEQPKSKLARPHSSLCLLVLHSVQTVFVCRFYSRSGSSRIGLLDPSEAQGVTLIVL